MIDKPIMRDPMDSEEAKILESANNKDLYYEHYVNATTKEINDIKWKLIDSIECNFSEREFNLLYRLSGFDLLTASESKSAIMLMAQKLGNIPIPKEDNE